MPNICHFPHKSGYFSNLIILKLFLLISNSDGQQFHRRPISAKQTITSHHLS
jgi:hypothetical protein